MANLNDRQLAATEQILLDPKETFLGSFSLSLATTVTSFLEITTGAKPVVFAGISVSTSANDLTLELREGATLTGGTVVKMMSLNRILPSVPIVAVKHSVTESAAGTLILDPIRLVNAAAGVGMSRVEGLGRLGSINLVLAANTTYSIEIDPIDGATEEFGISLTLKES